MREYEAVSAVDGDRSTGFAEFAEPSILRMFSIFHTYLGMVLRIEVRRRLRIKRALPK